MADSEGLPPVPDQTGEFGQSLAQPLQAFPGVPGAEAGPTPAAGVTAEQPEQAPPQTAEEPPQANPDA
ncbi:MAG TPA: hypothetical protein VII55_02185 [Candidatus Saccharimonadales bacterium]